MGPKFSKNYKKPSPQSLQGRLQVLSQIREEAVTTCQWNRPPSDHLKLVDNKDLRSTANTANKPQPSCQAQNSRNVRPPKAKKHKISVQESENAASTMWTNRLLSKNITINPIRSTLKPTRITTERLCSPISPYQLGNERADNALINQFLDNNPQLCEIL
jgi:hypothetical protein